MSPSTSNILYQKLECPNNPDLSRSLPQGKILTNEQQKLQEIVSNCHAQKKLIRFWGIPGEAPKSEKFWTLFLAEKVDLLGCDCPACLHNFIQKQTNKD